jgi:hypothetical protein
MEHSNDYFLALLLGYGTIGLVFGLANIFSVKSEKRKSIIEIYISLIMASVLGSLAFVTYINLKESETIVQSNQKMSFKIRTLADETEKMSLEALNMAQKTQHMARGTQDMAEQTLKVIEETKKSIEKTQKIVEETKKIMDISLRQFRIQSYPTFLIEIEDPYSENGSKYQSMLIRNEGEITAFNVSFLYVDVFQTETGGLYFHIAKDGRYKNLLKKQDEDVVITKQLADMSPLGLEIRLPRDSSIILSSTNKNQGRWNLENLKYSIIVIRFKVPYDKKYRYETFAYNLKKEEVMTAEKEEAEWKYTWKVLDTDTQSSLLKRYNKTVSDNKVKKFLSDYNTN